MDSNSYNKYTPDFNYIELINCSHYKYLCENTIYKYYQNYMEMTISKSLTSLTSLTVFRLPTTSMLHVNDNVVSTSDEHSWVQCSSVI